MKKYIAPQLSIFEVNSLQIIATSGLGQNDEMGGDQLARRRNKWGFEEEMEEEEF